MKIVQFTDEEIAYLNGLLSSISYQLSHSWHSDMKFLEREQNFVSGIIEKLDIEDVFETINTDGDVSF